jgi:ParB family chromosome partitioning protein
VENIQRQDLNAIEIALGMKRLIEECGLTQEAMADKVGKKRSTVSNYMRLLNLPDQVQLALKEGIITMGHAKAIAGVEADKQLRVLNRCVNKSLSVRQAEELARKIAQGPAVITTTDEEYPESYLRLVELLEPYFSQSISIKRSKSGGGKIVIDFSDDEQIENIISRLQNR